MVNFETVGLFKACGLTFVKMSITYIYLHAYYIYASLTKEQSKNEIIIKKKGSPHRLNSTLQDRKVMTNSQTHQWLYYANTLCGKFHILSCSVVVGMKLHFYPFMIQRKMRIT